MTETTRHHLHLIIAGAGALAAAAALHVPAGSPLGFDDHETLVSLVRWLAAAGLSFAALRPLRPIMGTGR